MWRRSDPFTTAVHWSGDMIGMRSLGSELAWSIGPVKTSGIGRNMVGMKQTIYLIKSMYLI